MAERAGGRVEPEPLICVECGRTDAFTENQGWRAYLTDDHEVAIYCPACSKREFGPAR